MPYLRWVLFEQEAPILSAIGEEKINCHYGPSNGFCAAGAEEAERGNHPDCSENFHGKLYTAGEDRNPVYAHRLHGGAQAEHQSERGEEGCVDPQAHEGIVDNLRIAGASNQPDDERTAQIKDTKACCGKYDFQQTNLADSMTDAPLFSSAPVLSYKSGTCCSDGTKWLHENADNSAAGSVRCNKYFA